MKCKIIKTVEVDVTRLRTKMKIRDEFQCDIYDKEGYIIKSYDGYVPDFFPDIHHGDYLYLNIDLETGQILNWKKPTPEQLSKFLNESNDEIY